MADLASSNVRMMMFIADKRIRFKKKHVEACEKDGFIVLLDSPCIAHILH